MFIKLHGVISNEKIVINVKYIEVMQEISKDSKKYASYYQAGARSLIRVNGKTIPIKETITQVENRMKALGGAPDEG